MFRQGAKIVMTSRDYIYKRARRDLKERPSRCSTRAR